MVENLPATDAEFLARCDCYLEGAMAGDELERFDAELTASAEKRSAFVRLCRVRASVIEAMNAGADSEVTAGRIGGASTAAVDSPPADFEPRRIRPAVQWMKRAAAIAAIALVGLAVYRLARSGDKQVAPSQEIMVAVEREPIARLSSVIDADWKGGESPRLGAALPTDELSLDRGLAEIVLRNQVVVVIQSPARFRINSEKQIDLVQGSLTANVPHDARGFIVQTAKANIVDLGTEFGVSAGDDQTQLVVFRGSVRVRATTDGADQRPVFCKAGGGARIDENAAELVVGDEERSGRRYVRNIREVREAVAVYGTGQAFDAVTGADAHWNIVRRSDMKVEAGQAFPAFHPTYLPADEKSAWISSAPASRITVPGVRVKFRTAFDIHGVDAATTRLTLKLAADDEVADVYLNGHSCGIQLQQYNVDRLSEFVLTKGFVEGQNQLEIEVVNVGENGGVSPFALRAQLSATAVRRPTTASSP